MSSFNENTCLNFNDFVAQINGGTSKIHLRDHGCKQNFIISSENVAKSIKIIPYSKNFVKLKFILCRLPKRSRRLPPLDRMGRSYLSDGQTLQPSHYGILFCAKNRQENKFYEIRYPHRRCRKCGDLLKDYGGKKKILHPFGPLVSDVWSDIHRIRHNKHRDPHPCQLPIHLLERLILMSTDEGDVILDPFMGTGTTAVAAARLGRKVIGIDLDPQYVEITQRKLAQEVPNSKIGDIWVSFHRGEIITIVDKDWELLKSHFVIPEDPRHIDFEKIKTGSAVVATAPQTPQLQWEIQEEKHCDCY